MSDRSTVRPIVLIVRDGWGRNPHPSHDDFNAIHLASTPRCDALLRDYPWTLIKTSGEDVGLPAGTMGNSEVGHQNLGAGRIVDQESVRITRAIREGTFFTNEVLKAPTTLFTHLAVFRLSEQEVYRFRLRVVDTIPSVGRCDGRVVAAVPTRLD